MQKIEKYCVGLDIGTNSVGWAITDLDNQLLKHKGKNTWGVRLFDQGETAEGRRLHRSMRRRIARRKARIQRLQRIFITEIQKVDPLFFMRLKETFLQQEDKNEKIKASGNLTGLFTKGDWNDRKYFEKFPTIYHLRSHLMNIEGKEDIRLVYLALHHIMKYRGNFLNQEENFSSDIDFNKMEEDILNLLSGITAKESLYKNVQKIGLNLIKILNQKNISRGQLKDQLNEALTPIEIDPKVKKEICNGILGYKTNFITLFGLEVEKDEESKLKFSLSEDYDEEEKLKYMGIEKEDIFYLLKKIFSMVKLKDILGNKNTLSEAMIEKYGKHHDDLQLLKKVFIDYLPREEYNKIFKKPGKTGNTYSNYVKVYNGGEKISYNKCTQEDLCKEIEKILLKHEEQIMDKKAYDYLLREAMNRSLLPKQRTIENGSIPYQIHMAEMDKIIEKQGSHYPFLKENHKKLQELIAFRIPYYVGPLNENSPFAFIKKNYQGDINPWNFEEIVDRSASAECFMSKMMNKCSYLLDEDVLPKDSLLYSEYNVLNELNNLRIEKMSSANNRLSDLSRSKVLFTDENEKRIVIDELFKKTKKLKVTEKDLIDFMHNHQMIPTREISLRGFQKENEFASNLNSYRTFEKILGGNLGKHETMIEEIIRWIALFEDKEILIKKLKEKYSQALTTKQIEKISRLNYKGWGRLSNKLLDGIMAKDQDGRKLTIIDVMRERPMNFMQVITDKKLNFSEIIEKESGIESKGNTINYEEIDQLQGSPKIKRGIWQTVKIVEEIRKIMGKDPERISFEMAREDQTSKRTISRYKQLDELFKGMKSENEAYSKSIHDELKGFKDQDKKLREQRLFLYFIQNGKCMYSGEPLDINALSTYELDHIIPRSYIKDNSIDNLVLVKRIENQDKNNQLLLSRKVVSRMQKFWEKLYKSNLITSKKLYNLTRVEFSEKELEGFINRQLVETRQISKHLVSIFNQYYTNTEIYTIKAKLVDDLRKALEVYKVREVNDCHHAHDAYMVSVLSNFVSKTFPYLKDEITYGEYYKFKKNPLKDPNFLRGKKDGVIISSFKTTQEGNFGLWDAEDEILKIKKAVNYKDYFITKKLEENTGEFFKQTVFSPGTMKNLIPLKKDLDPNKYGGYSSMNKAYSVVFSGKDLSKKRAKSGKHITYIPIPVAKEIKDGKMTTKEYIETLGFEEVKITRDKIMKYQLALEDNNPIFIVSDVEKQNAKQLFLDRDSMKTLNDIKINDLVDNKENDERLTALFKTMFNKISDQFPVVGNVSEGLQNNESNFEELTIEEKVKTLLEIMKITRATGERASLKNIGLSGEAGRLGRTIKLENFVIVNQSVTGMFETREEL